MHGLPESMQKKIVRIVRVFREEMTTAIEDEKKAIARFLSLCGKWDDKKTAEEQINEIYKSRRSRRDIVVN
jgi:hypothetical protein